MDRPELLVLPPRVRALVRSMWQQVDAAKSGALEGALTEFEKQVFRCADQAPSTEAQTRCFDTLREIKRQRGELVSRLHAALGQSVVSAFAGNAAASTAVTAKPARRVSLSLVASMDMEERAVLAEISARAEIRHSQGLYFLGQRLGVLVGGPAMDNETNPFSPNRLADVLREACQVLELPFEHRALLYRAYEQTMMGRFGLLLDALNGNLVEHKVLPNLQHMLVRLPPASARVASAARAPAASVQPEAREAATPKAMEAVAENRPDQAATSVPIAAVEDHPIAPAAVPEAPGAEPSDTFEALRGLLDHGPRTGAPAAANASPVTSSDVQAVLGVLQSKPSTPMKLGGRWVHRTMAHLKQDLLNQLRPLAQPGKTPTLPETDSDTIDLVGMLFDNLMKQARPNSVGQQLLTRLQVPLLRVALEDKRFFNQRDHAAREFLNAIAETSLFWVEDEAADRPLIEKMQMLVDRVVREFDGDISVFDTLFNDLGKHLGTLGRKAEVAERRHVDAARGRERLDFSRRRAAELVNERIRSAKPPRLVRALMENAWVDVIALTLLRQGEDSAVLRARLAVVDELIEAANTRKGQVDEHLFAVLSEGLSQVGYHADEIRGMLTRLLQTQPDENEEGISQTEIALRLKTRARLGDDAGAEHAPDPVLELNSAERDLLSHIREIPFGTWFEVVDEHGASNRRKLAWFSTLTSHCLFVNSRGQRVEETTIECLAREMAAGRTRIVDQSSGSLIDRAWQAVVGVLRQFGGRSAPVQEAGG